MRGKSVADASHMSPFPFLNTPAFWWVVLGAALLFAVAILIVLLRRRDESNRRIAIEWTRVEALLDDRSVSASDRVPFLDMVKRCRPRDPISSATRRHDFDTCVDEYMRYVRDSKGIRESLQVGVVLRDVRIALGLDYVPYGQRIGSTRELHTGQMLWLALARDVAPRWVRAHVSLVDEARFIATAGSDTPDAAREIREGTELRCRLWREDDARYLFPLIVTHVDEGPQRWTFYHTRDMQRIQDRAHYRIRIDMPADFDVLNAPLHDDYEGVADLSSVTSFHGRVINLSAGGVAIIAHHAIPKQVLLRFAVVLPESGRMVVTVKPVETMPQSAGRFFVRGYFVGLDEESRDAIARFVLHRQQRLIAPTGGEKVTLQ